MLDAKYWVVLPHHPFLEGEEGRKRIETSVENLWLKVSINPLFSVVKLSFLIILQYSLNSVLKYQKIYMGWGTKKSYCSNLLALGSFQCYSQYMISTSLTQELWITSYLSHKYFKKQYIYSSKINATAKMLKFQFLQALGLPVKRYFLHTVLQILSNFCYFQMTTAYDLMQKEISGKKKKEKKTF